MKTKISERTVEYFALYSYWSCYDDGGIAHDTSLCHSTVKLISTKEVAARIEAQDLGWEYAKSKKFCHCHPGPKFVTGVLKKVYERTEDGFERRTEERLLLPQAKECPCGKKYIPLRGETPCHELTEVKNNKEQ